MSRRSAYPPRRSAKIALRRASSPPIFLSCCCRLASLDSWYRPGFDMQFIRGSGSHIYGSVHKTNKLMTTPGKGCKSLEIDHQRCLSRRPCGNKGEGKPENTPQCLATLAD